MDMSEHDTPDGRPPYASEPSPFASHEGAGGALISRTAPADQWPAPFSKPSSFIYTPRVPFDAYDWGIPSNEIDAQADRFRAQSTNRRLIQCHGEERAFSIACDDDEATSQDLRAWRTLGCSGLKVVS